MKKVKIKVPFPRIEVAGGLDVTDFFLLIELLGNAAPPLGSPDELEYFISDWEAERLGRSVVSKLITEVECGEGGKQLKLLFTPGIFLDYEDLLKFKEMSPIKQNQLFIIQYILCVYYKGGVLSERAENALNGIFYFSSGEYTRKEGLKCPTP